MQGLLHALRSPRHRALIALVALACLVAMDPFASAAPSSAASRAGAPAGAALFPKFSAPKTVLVADAHGLSDADLLTATTLQGLYNGTQHSSRLYLNRRALDGTWLTTLPKNVQVEQVQPDASGTLLQTLLERFKSGITGAIVTNPENPDTVNLATTMAGIDHGIVIEPSQVDMVQALGIKVLHSFDTDEFTGYGAVQTYRWGVDHLLAHTSRRVLVALAGSHPGDIRDYAVATKAFVYNLTTGDAGQEALMARILAHTPSNTPVLGYVPNENQDVAFLSAHGHFLNGSDTVTNTTVWAALPSLGAMRQPSEPAPLKAQPDTVYVGFLESDGDNLDYMQGSMYQLWQSADLGSVPVGWTLAPPAADLDPPMQQYYYDHLPHNSELVAGPSGIGYATQMAGSDLDEFARLSGAVMSREDLHTVDSFQAQGSLPRFATESGIPSIAATFPLVQQQMGHTTVIGQGSGYLKTGQQLFDSVRQQAATLKSGQPLFLEPLVDAWTVNPTEVLHVAQQLALAGRKSGIRYVFTTPTELAQTAQRYRAGREAGLPTSNVQSMTGDEALAKPIVSPPFDATPTTPTGPNLVTNPSGAFGTTGWSTDSFSWGTGSGSVSATTYEGQPALHYTTSNVQTPSWTHYYPAVTNGHTYTFQLDVAGSGQVYLDTYANDDWESVPVRLSSQFRHLTWTVRIPANAPGGQSGAAPQLQVRSSGAGPASAYIRNADVREAVPAS